MGMGDLMHLSTHVEHIYTYSILYIVAHRFHLHTFFHVWGIL